MLGNELADTISLDGLWDFRLGEEADWNIVQVPGCWEAQGYSKYTEGPARYRRRFFVPESWRGLKAQLEFGAVSYAAEIYLNNFPIGSHRGLWTPFALDASVALLPGEENILEVVVFKPGDRYPMRSCLAGFIPDVSTTFGGLWQPVLLRLVQFALQDLQLDPDVDASSLRVRCQAATHLTLDNPEWLVEVSIAGENLLSQHVPYYQHGGLDVTLAVPGALLWSPAQPNLYTIQVTLTDSGHPVARLSNRTGFRRLEAAGSQLLLNGQPFMVRGILSWGWDPDRIAPFYTREQALEEMQRVRQLGFNLIKLCLFVPNQDYLDVADEVGMLLWQEFPMWLPQVTPELRRQAPDEYAAYTLLTRHHPCVALYSLGCELNRSVDGELLHALDRSVRSQVSDVLVCDNSGSGESYGGLQFDFSDFTDYHPYYDLHFFEPLMDHWRRDWQRPRPWIFGEFCDSDTFRDLEPIIQANQGQRPWWLTRDNPVTAWRVEAKAMLEVQERLAAANLLFSPQEITRISYAQAQVIRKFTLEALRRRSGMGGYIITGLRDTPISTSGVWDDFQQSKWEAEQFRTVNDDSILCLDTGRRRRWFHGGDRPDRLDAYNFHSGEQVYWHIILHTTSSWFPPGSPLTWSLTSQQGDILQQGSTLLPNRVQAGEPVEAGAITCDLPQAQRAVSYFLQASLESNGCRISNQWPIWVYPPLHEPPHGLAIIDPTGILDECGDWLERVPRLRSCQEADGYRGVLSTVWHEDLTGYVQQGGRALILQQGGRPFPAQRCPFWREAIKFFHEHPIWSEFPNQGYTDLQFLGLASDVAFDRSKTEDFLPGLSGYRSVLQRLDAREYRVRDYIFEAQLGKGVLLACSLRLQGGTGAQPSGWERNVSGSSLLQILLDNLIQPA